MMMAKNSKDQSIADPLEPGHMPGQNSASPVEDVAVSEAEKELDDALQQTFPASDPISSESTLVSGGRR
jgi:hypothetical protein